MYYLVKLCSTSILSFKYSNPSKSKPLLF